MQQPATKRNFVPLVILLTLVINLLVALLFLRHLYKSTQDSIGRYFLF